MTAIWQDRQGRFSLLRAGALALAIAPATWIALQGWMGWLAPRALNNATLQSGDWALRLLWLTLLITPLRRILDAPHLIGVRRTFGLASFAYSLLHIGLYAANQKFDLAFVGSEIVHRLYLGIGMVAMIGLAILAAHSTDRAIERLGSAEWTRIHKAVYLIAVLALLHFYIQSKLDVSEALMMSGFYIWLMGWRQFERRQWATATGLGALAAIAALATLAMESAWYGLVNHAPVLDQIRANFEFEYEIRPMWIVLAAALAAAGCQALFGRTYRLNKRAQQSD